MTTDPFSDVVEFHRAFDVPTPGVPGEPEPERILLRDRLLREEYSELTRAMAASDLEGIAGELVDLIYVAIGTAVEYGIDLAPVWRAVHKANMSKLFPDGRAWLREDGKILKPDDWTPPDLKACLDAQRGGRNG